ncbi:hypothetical protein CC80DRAFT_545244 [Byssothecium circinans]|uniref:Uncharacterized protein n=1 Tax=Byssothecium circinans TaxID=147558 RepID=A0A6A5U4L2_9PLEO|nr:hypothetical protein CC80DRAFT_545244 [Byssothecium circinans]
MLANATLDNLLKGNEGEVDLLEQIKEGATEIFDGLIEESFKRKLELGCLKEDLGNIRRSAAHSNDPCTSQRAGELARIIAAVIKACKRAVEDSYNRFDTVYDSAHEKFKQQVQDWTKEKEIQDKRRVKNDKLEQVCKELSCAGMWKLHRLVRELYDQECDDKTEVTPPDYSQIRGERDIVVDKAWSAHQKESDAWKKRIESLEQIAKAEGIELRT